MKTFLSRFCCVATLMASSLVADSQIYLSGAVQGQSTGNDFSAQGATEIIAIADNYFVTNGYIDEVISNMLAGYTNVIAATNAFYLNGQPASYYTDTNDIHVKAITVDSSMTATTSAADARGGVTVALTADGAAYTNGNWQVGVVIGGGIGTNTTGLGGGGYTGTNALPMSGVITNTTTNTAFSVTGTAAIIQTFSNANFAVKVIGGLANTNNGYSSMIFGGYGNYAYNEANNNVNGVMLGGGNNSLGQNSDSSIIGGADNILNSDYSTIISSYGSSIGVSGIGNAILGGGTNAITNVSVPINDSAILSGVHSTVTNSGVTVIADASTNSTVSTVPNQLIIREQNGVNIVGSGLTLNGTNVIGMGQNTNYIANFNGQGKYTILQSPTIQTLATNIIYNNIVISGSTNSTVNGTYIVDFNTNHFAYGSSIFGAFYVWTNSTPYFVTVAYYNLTNAFGYPLWIQNTGLFKGEPVWNIGTTTTQNYFVYGNPTNIWNGSGTDSVVAASSSPIVTNITATTVFNGNGFTPEIIQWQIESAAGNSVYTAPHGFGHAPSHVDWYVTCITTDTNGPWPPGQKFEIQQQPDMSTLTKGFDGLTIRLNYDDTFANGSGDFLIPYAGAGGTNSQGADFYHFSNNWTNWVIEADVWP